MAIWEKVYQLVEKSSSRDIWECVSQVFQISPWKNIPLSQEPPEFFSYGIDNIIFNYHEDDRWCFYNFTQQTGENNSELKIVFAKKNHASNSKKRQTSHNLYFYEQAKGEPLNFCLNFFDLLKKKKLVSNKQTLNSVKEIVTEHVWSQFKENSSTKILIRHDVNQKENLLEQVKSIAEKLWFLDVKFYTTVVPEELAFLIDNTLDYLSSINPEIGEFLRSKLREGMNSKEILSRLIEYTPEKPIQVSVYHPHGVSSIDCDLTELNIEIFIRSIYKVKQSELSKEFDQNFSDFKDKYPEQDWRKIIDKDIQKKLSDRAHKIAQPSPQEAPRQNLTTEFPESCSREYQRVHLESKKLQDENDSLRRQIEDLKREKEELKEQLAQEKSKSNDLQEQLDKKESTLTTSQNDARNGIITLKIPCSEQNLFPDEIEDFLYLLLYSALEQQKRKLPDDKKDEVTRKRDVLKVLIQEKLFNWNKSKTNIKLEQIKNTILEEALLKKHEGFNLTTEKNHFKYTFYGRYKISFSKTTSDKIRVREKRINEIKARFFLISN